MSLWPSPPSPPDLPPPPAAVSRLTVRVALDGTEPEAWRRFTAPGDLRLDRVHDLLQQVMGWTDSHLHQFSLGPPHVSPRFLTEADVEEGEQGVLETAVRLDQVLREAGDELTYAYDFGDGWTHTLVLEQADAPGPNARADVLTQPGETAYAVTCLAGEGACPPEDVGGLGGYQEVADWVRGGEDPTHAWDNGLTTAEMREWLPHGWHPDRFDVDRANAAIACLAPRDTAAALDRLPDELTDVMGRLRGTARLDLDEWLSAPAWGTRESFTSAEAEALTLGFRALLDAVGDGVKLTPGGYLPGRVVEQVLHDARLRADWIGKGNREDLTPPVLDLRERARRYGLLRKANGRLLPTALAGRLRDDPERLLHHVLSRTAADGRAWERIAGGFMLVAAVAGEPLDAGRGGQDRDEDAYDSVTRLLSAAGFRTADRGLPDRWDVFRGAQLHVSALKTFLAGVDTESTSDTTDLTQRVALALLGRMR